MTPFWSVSGSKSGVGEEDGETDIPEKKCWNPKPPLLKLVEKFSALRQSSKDKSRIDTVLMANLVNKNLVISD